MVNSISLIACHECDLMHRIPWVPAGKTARCSRCGALLIRRKKNSRERALALTLGGLILFGIANAFPFLSFQMESRVQETTLITGIRALYGQGMQALALLVLMTTVIIPFLQLSGMLYVLLMIQKLPVAPRLMGVFRHMQHLKPWSMTEVFMLGILVSIVKLSDMAQIIPGPALYAFMGLIFVLSAAVAVLDPDIVWNQWVPKS